MTYLDGNLSSNGLDDPALSILNFYSPWWNSPHALTHTQSLGLSSATLQLALALHREQLAAATIPFGAPHFISNLTEELNKPAYTWPPSVSTDLPNAPIQ
jgi:hypothetical protein